MSAPLEIPRPRFDGNAGRAVAAARISSGAGSSSGGDDAGDAGSGDGTARAARGLAGFVRQSRLKRAFDVALSGAGLVLSAPLWAAISLAVKLEDGGPVLYRQRRIGRGGAEFELLKLRTMVVGAERLGAGFAVNRGDPRITRVGRFLRKTSLDELPQLYNVLRGDMSLVGPRPTSFDSDTYSLWHTHRLEVPPGITGLWQVKGRNSMTFDERLRLDIVYIENRSFLLDLKILFQTFTTVVARSGA